MHSNSFLFSRRFFVGSRGVREVGAWPSAGVCMGVTKRKKAKNLLVYSLSFVVATADFFCLSGLCATRATKVFPEKSIYCPNCKKYRIGGENVPTPIAATSALYFWCKFTRENPSIGDWRN